ncbi:MAG: hypothetical protein LBD45_02755 [Bacteroidales bacterium]|jgi:hypothetical protein|nr:hypothetical protein [Bacteroidales bacterium]
MKQFITLILSVLMLTVAIQPTFAFHFCGSELHSFGLLDDDEETNCCKIPGNDNQNEKTIIFHPVTNCCTTQTISIATDIFSIFSCDLKTDIQTTTTPTSIYPASLQSANSCCSIILHWRYPPDGFTKNNADFLAIFCTLLI